MNIIDKENSYYLKKNKTRFHSMKIRLFSFVLACMFFTNFVNKIHFAAVVSDNDGAAFITKAEFDSLNNTFQAQLNKYNTEIDNKIDGAISSYLSGVKVGQTDMLYNNLETLQKNYNVYWSSQTDGLVTTRVPYGAEYQINIGSRGTEYGGSAARCAQGVYNVTGSFVKFPIITKETEGTTTRYVINYWEERKPWLTYCGFFLYNGDTWDSWPSGNINGVFATQNMNPNTNDIYARQDQWWNPGNGGNSAPWAMSIWSVYSTMAQNKDTKSIFIYPNAGDTYCWNESDTTKSSGNGGGGTMACTNKGSWANGGGAAAYTGEINLIAYTSQDNAKFPWCHTKYSYKGLYDDRIRTITGVTKPISDGLLLTSDAGPGTLKITAKGSYNGSLSIIVKDNEDKNILKTVNSSVTTSDRIINVDLTTLAKNKEFHVWIKYTPSSQATLTIGNIYYERRV